MKGQIGLSIVIMIVCFNLGLMIINAAGLYNVPVDPEAEEAITSFSNKYMTTGNLLVTMLVSGGTGALIGLGIARVAGGSVDTLRAIGITSFGTAILPLWYNSLNVMLGLADSLTGTSGGLASTIIIIFISFQVLMVVAFILQLATGGWLNVK